MYIEKVLFRNFNSFGENDVELDFNSINGLILLYGENGAGKSSIMEAITFGLFGQVLNKNLSHLPNRFNKNLYVEVSLKANSSKYLIKRGLDPNIFEVYKDGSRLNLAYKKDLQKHLEDEVYGINFDIFSSLIFLSVSGFKSFTKKLKVSDKQAIVDKLFGFEIITNLYKINKEELTSARNEISKITALIEELKESKNKANQQLKKIKQEQQVEFDKIKAEYIKIISEVSTSISKLSKKLEAQKNKYKKYNDNLSKAKIMLASLNKDISSIEKEIKIYNNDKCPYCHNDLTTEFHKQHLEKLKELKATYLEKKSKGEATINKLDGKLKDLNSSIVKLNEQISKENIKLFSYKGKLDEVSKVKQAGVKEVKEIIDTTVAKISSYVERLNSLHAEFNSLKLLDSILGENGIKQMLFNRIMPIFNNEIKDVLDRLGINFSVTINNKFHVDINDLNYNVPIETLSTGQLKKIDLAIIITFLKIIKTRISNLNILFLDEIFSSVDDEGRYGALSILKEISDSYGLSIFIVNHVELPGELFAHKILVKFTNGFSIAEINSL